MDQDFNNQPMKSNRFIFSDEFYDHLDNVVPEEKKVSFDAPVMPPKSVQEPIKEEKKEENQDLFTSFFNNQNINNSQSVIPEPKVEENPVSSFDFTNPIKQEEPQSNLVNLGTIEEPTINPVEIETKEPESYTPPVIGEKISNEIIAPKDDFNVESGIDTELEQELFKSKIEAQRKTQIVENTNFYERPSEEKMVYRAKRSAQPITPIWLQEETDELKEEETTTKVPVEDIIPEHHEVDVQPKVINIDEELAKLRELNKPIEEPEVNYEENLSDLPATKSTLLDELREKEHQTGKISILARYGEDFCSRDYITNPAIGRNEEIKQLILILLTPEKSGILVGKPGIGKTSIVEGLAYQLQRNNVPDALKGYRIVSVKTTSLLGTLPTGETRLQTLIDELKELDKIILFMDEIHMLMGATNESSLDFANMFKESLGRGSIKMIGATTNDEYERYVLRDKAFVRRFQRVDVEEPTRDQTIKILMGTLPKIEKNTGATLKYSNFVQSEIMAFIVDITTEYKRVYGIGSRYPDICLTLLAQAFSQAVFDNRKEVTIQDIRNAIENSKNIYPDVIRKELVNFDKKFNQLIKEEQNY